MHGRLVVGRSTLDCDLRELLELSDGLLKHLQETLPRHTYEYKGTLTLVSSSVRSSSISSCEESVCRAEQHRHHFRQTDHFVLDCGVGFLDISELRFTVLIDQVFLS